MDNDKLLLAEYTHFSESFWRNEELGERRVNFFITLTTAIIAGIVALFTSDSDQMTPMVVQKIATIALAGNLIFGLVTFIRILHRNKVTDEYKEILHYLRNEMKTRSSDLKDYKLPFSDKKWWFTGGLAEIVAAMNSLVATIMVGIWKTEWWPLLITFIFTFVLQWSFIRKRSKKNEIRK